MKCNGGFLLISPKFFGYEKEIKIELERQLKADVSYCDIRPKNDFFTKLFMRIGATFLIKKRIKQHQDGIIEKIRQEKFSTILLINPEGLSNEFFKKIKDVVPGVNIILYLWDSIENKPLVKPLLSNFSQIYSFDKNDCQQYGFDFLPLFFSNSYDKIARLTTPKIDIAFIGTVHSQRMNVIKKVEAASVRDNFVFYKYLYIQNWIIFVVRKIADKNFKNVSQFTFNFTPLTSQEINSVYADTKAILDIEHDKQKGLTMRTFETLGAGLKLITTNKNIIDYDIYTPENVLVIDKDNVHIDPEFLNTPFKDYPEDIIGKYSLSSWVSTILSSQKRDL
ncbi:hypothetical protein [Erwinia sorbitola]|uniref:Lipopolysaccharide biosynthesis protein n=1 Tax=Erwinia sorbitola TaxID=2681984 RepID=A0A6I6EL53_9GAMM|nr:hypothetical protein [Erwinia sorbitola]QGU87016.1 hypothetical protein GN242_07210 [Erwinia sorbitola]